MVEGLCANGSRSLWSSSPARGCQQPDIVEEAWEHQVLYTEEASGLEPVTGHNQWGRQMQLTYTRALFLITSPLHRRKGLFMDEK